MADDVDIKIIKKTQDSLAAIIKKPPLLEKYLKKPPFRFLHDILVNVNKVTKFFDGLYSEDELESDKVKDKERKMEFLQKAIDVVGWVTGEPLLAKPSKIVAGHEPQRTNEFLQALGQALSNKLDSKEAVKKVLAGEKPQKKPKDKQGSRGRPTREAANKAKTKAKEPPRKEPKKPSPPQSSPSAPAVNGTDPSSPIVPTTLAENAPPPQQPTEPPPRPSASPPRRPPTSRKTSAMNHQPVAEQEPAEEAAPPPKSAAPPPKSAVPSSKSAALPPKSAVPPPKSAAPPRSAAAPPPLPTQDVSPEPADSPVQRPRTARASARPASARLAPPKVKVRHRVENAEEETRMGSAAKGVSNLILDSSAAEADDNFVVMQEVAPQIPQDMGGGDVSTQELEELENEGLLMRQIMETKRLLEGSAAPQRTDSATSGAGLVREVAGLRELVQAVSRQAAPLGRLLEYLQEDGDSMVAELGVWRAERVAAAEKLRTANLESEAHLAPLRAELADLEVALTDQQANLTVLRGTLHRSEQHMARMLASLQPS